MSVECCLTTQRNNAQYSRTTTKKSKSKLQNYPNTNVEKNEDKKNVQVYILGGVYTLGVHTLVVYTRPTDFEC